MAKISKQALSKKDEMMLFLQLCTLLNTKKTYSTKEVLSELLGAEEQLMLAKRFAIIALVWKERSLYSIAKKLHVSTSTVSRIKAMYQLGHYNKIITALEKPNVTIVSVLQTIDDILHLGGIMPHYGQTFQTEAYRRAPRRKLKKP